MGAYQFIKELRERGGEVINMYIITGGTYLEYSEQGSKEITLHKA